MEKFKKKSSKQFRKRESEPFEQEQQEEQETLQVKKAKVYPTIGPAFKASDKSTSLQENTAFRTLILEDNTTTDIKNTNDEYKSINGYNTFINKTKKATQSSNHLKQGPLKGLQQIRISTRFDYAAGICKDYKETGYCGFGDTCIFMHDRSDYKQGWELELEYEKNLQNQKEQEELPPEVEDLKDDFPTNCPICFKDFQNPVKTNCGHYFCESCCLKKFAKSQKCAECSRDTGGVFNSARDLVLHLESKKKRELLKKEELSKIQRDLE